MINQPDDLQHDCLRSYISCIYVILPCLFVFVVFFYVFLSFVFCSVFLPFVVCHRDDLQQDDVRTYISLAGNSATLAAAQPVCTLYNSSLNCSTNIVANWMQSPSFPPALLALSPLPSSSPSLYHCHNCSFIIRTRQQ